MWLLRSLRILAILTPVMPDRIGYTLCRTIGLLAWCVMCDARRAVNDNLRTVLPHVSTIRRQRFVIRSFTTVVMNYYDLLRLRSVDRNQLDNILCYEGLEHLDRAVQEGRGVIMFSAHTGNFSAVARFPALLGYETAIIAERIEPPQLFSYMCRLRTAIGIHIVPPGGNAAFRVLRHLKANGVLMVAGDRDIVGQSCPVDFFGRLTHLPIGPLLLARRSGAVMLPTHTYRRNDRRSVVRICPPIDLQCTGNPNDDLMANAQTLARKLEPMIATDPGQWGVLQRVWPPRTHYGQSEGISPGADFEEH